MGSGRGGEGRLFDLLVERGLLTREQARGLERDAANWRAGPTETLLARGLVHPEILASAIAEVAGLPLAHEVRAAFDPDFAEVSDLDFFVKHRLMPWCRDGGTPVIAVVNPFQAEAVLRSELGPAAFALCIVTERTLTEAMLQAFSGAKVAEATGGLAVKMPEFSAKGGLTLAQILAVLLLPLGLCWLFYRFPYTVWTAVSIAAGSFFIATTVFRLFLLLVSLWPKRRMKAPVARSSGLAHYSVLVALYDEADVIAHTVHALGRIDYPWTKLDILLILEETDLKTRRACEDLRLDGRFRIITVPNRKPRTKPKACNFALPFARGEMIVLYDAEDRPDPEQLKAAIEGFAHAGPDVACLQARLNFYNARENWLTAGIMAQTPQELNPACT